MWAASMYFAAMATLVARRVVEANTTPTFLGGTESTIDIHWLEKEQEDLAGADTRGYSPIHLTMPFKGAWPAYSCGTTMGVPPTMA
jgi:hypothetical protein